MNKVKIREDGCEIRRGLWGDVLVADLKEKVLVYGGRDCFVNPNRSFLNHLAISVNLLVAQGSHPEASFCNSLYRQESVQLARLQQP